MPKLFSFFAVSIALLLGSADRLLSQTTAPSPRSADVIRAEIESAHRQFNAAVKSPSDIADPDRRKAIAPKAIPPLKTMVNDFAELAEVEPATKRRAGQLALQFNAFLSVLGDRPTIDHLQAMAGSKDPSESLRGQSSQLLARWVLAGKDETAQGKIADEIHPLDLAYPQSEDLTFLTVTVSQSTLSETLQKKLLQMARQMQNPVAEKVRKVTAATTKP